MLLLFSIDILFEGRSIIIINNAPTEITDPRLLALGGRATPEDCNARPTHAFFLSLVEREEHFHTV